jgi:hypothetical protein
MGLGYSLDFLIERLRDRWGTYPIYRVARQDGEQVSDAEETGQLANKFVVFRMRTDPHP